MSQPSHVKDDLNIDGMQKHNLEAGSIKVVKSQIELPDEPAAAFLTEHEHQWGNYDPQEARKVLRKIDFRLMPLIIGTITIAAVDVSCGTRNVSRS